MLIGSINSVKIKITRYIKMKLSLAWIFDHIDADWKKQDAKEIYAKFNATTAEIEKFYSLKIDLSPFYFCKIHANSPRGISVGVPERSYEFLLPERHFDFPNAQYFLIKIKNNVATWANFRDFGFEKDELMPPFNITEEELKGSWRNKFEAEDIILEVDNKSITHRPDMWCHRGFAREIAAFLQLPFKPKEQFLTKHSLMQFDQATEQTRSSLFTIENQAPKECNLFSGLYFSQIENKPSDLFIASRLMKTGSRPINSLVDLTNYLMNDWSQPLHIYDADKIPNKKIIVRMATEGEKLTLLDGVNITLSSNDIVVADSQNPMCLAGVRGGQDKAITSQTKSIFLEAANFDAGTVRRTAQRHKIRTDSSARYEKTLDPNIAIDATFRFLKLLQQYNINAIYSDEIVVVGKKASERTIQLSHEFLEKRAGTPLSEEDVIRPLEAMEFKVLKSFSGPDNKSIYIVTIPTFRSSKDISTKEDILEEVVRHFGFNNIPLDLPHILRQPYEQTATMRTRKIKYILANAAAMTEQQNYSLYDEQILSLLGYAPNNTLKILNPVSENYLQLANSLIPMLLKNIKDNHVHRDELRFFEFGRVWQIDSQSNIREQRSLAGVFFKKRQTVDFYSCKEYVNLLFKTLEIDSNISWLKQNNFYQPWYMEHQTATIFSHNRVVGAAGKMDPFFLNKLDLHTECDAFFFELDADYLISAPKVAKRYKPISKYQDTYFDLSLTVPLEQEAQKIKDAIRKSNSYITKVDLLDFFEKPEWQNVRSITFRVWANSPDKTLEKDEIENIRMQAISSIESFGVKLRF